MKTARLVLGIISMVLFLFIVFQSCAAGMVNAIEENGESSGTAGLLLALLMLSAGIVGVCTRKGVIGGFVAAGLYALGGLIGLIGYSDSFADLIIWVVVCFAFAVVYAIGAYMTKRAANRATPSEGEWETYNQ